MVPIARPPLALAALLLVSALVAVSALGESPSASATGRAGCGNAEKGGHKGERLEGTRAHDLIRGRGGNDRIKGRGSGDCLHGGKGADAIEGGTGRDGLWGSRGADTLRGGSGHDRLNGGPGRDRILARDGVRDIVRCGTGRDHAIVDAKDATRGCERTKHPRGGGNTGGRYPSLTHASWQGDFDSGCQLVGSASGAWSTNETNGDYTGGSTTIERNIVGEGQCAARFTDSPSNTMVRSELGRSATGADPEFTFEMLVYVPSGQTFPKGTSLTQTKMEKGADGRGCYGGGWGISDGTGTTGGKLDLNTVFACTTPQPNGQHNFPAGTLPRDRWFALKVHEKFSNNPQVGFVEAWKDDDGPGPGGYVQVVPKTHLDNESSGQHVRLRIGSYRQATDHRTTLYIDGSRLRCKARC
jgi:hypothetical protein